MSQRVRGRTGIAAAGRLLLSALALLVALGVAPRAARAQEAAASSPQVVDVGVHVLNVGRFELSTGAYTMDFYLTLASDAPIAIEDLEFMNGRPSSVDRIRTTTNGGRHVAEYRIQASLYSNLGLQRYPFDSHRLKVALEPRLASAERMVLRADPAENGIDEQVTLVGWDLAGWTADSEQHVYSVSDETYSRFVFAIDLRRFVLTSILKAFLPAAFIVIVGLLSLLLLPAMMGPRLALNTSSVLGAVMFHLTVTSQIPPVGYLTFADRFMIVCYIVLVAALASTIAMMRHSDKKDEAQALRIYHRALRIVPALAAVLYTAAFLLSL